MKDKQVPRAFFAIFSFSFLALSLLTGCSWSAEGNGVRVNSPPDESQDEENRFQSP